MDTEPVRISGKTLYKNYFFDEYIVNIGRVGCETLTNFYKGNPEMHEAALEGFAEAALGEHDHETAVYAIGVLMSLRR
jgi:hypothetical protein